MQNLGKMIQQDLKKIPLKGIQRRANREWKFVEEWMMFGYSDYNGTLINEIT